MVESNFDARARNILSCVGVDNQINIDYGLLHADSPVMGGPIVPPFDLHFGSDIESAPAKIYERGKICVRWWLCKRARGMCGRSNHQ